MRLDSGNISSKKKKKDILSLLGDTKETTFKKLYQTNKQESMERKKKNSPKALPGNFFPKEKSFEPHSHRSSCLQKHRQIYSIFT